MYKHKLMTGTLAIAASVAAIPLTSAPASAFGFAPASWTANTKNLGWSVESRAGAIGKRDYEFGIGSNSATTNHPGQIDRNWTNGEDVAWSLTWTGKQVSFTIGTQTLSYTPANPQSNYFNAFSLKTQAQPSDGKVSPGTNMFFEVNKLNGTSVTPAVSSTAEAPDRGKATGSPFFASDKPIFSLAGIVRLKWDSKSVNPNDPGAGRNIAIQLSGYDTGERPTEAVPEPTSIGVLVAGVLGVRLARKRKQDKDKGNA